MIAELDRIFDLRGMSSVEKAKVWETITAIVDWRTQHESAPQDPADLQRALSDPRLWARIALESPDLLELVERRESAPGSFGEWLNVAIHEERRRQNTPNVVDIASRKSPEKRRG
jgi:hypothetical protein